MDEVANYTQRLWFSRIPERLVQRQQTPGYAKLHCIAWDKFGNPVVAAQRVTYAYPHLAHEHIGRALINA
jgi:hypothetical protein